MISGLLLSAGLSSRFGSPKALASINNTRAILFLLEKMISTRIDEIIVILGADCEQIEPCLFKHKKIRVVYNKDYKFGQTSSVQTGLNNVHKDTLGFMIFPVDCPFIANRTVDTLIEHFKTQKSKILIPSCAGRRGHPPVFDICFKKDILGLSSSRGINEVMSAHAALTQIVELTDYGITSSFNTPEELTAVKKAIQIS
jgi:molybdenum cofactor cytidylyltransferase